MFAVKMQDSILENAFMYSRVVRRGKPPKGVNHFTVPESKYLKPDKLELFVKETFATHIIPTLSATVLSIGGTIHHSILALRDLSAAVLSFSCKGISQNLKNSSLNALVALIELVCLPLIGIVNFFRPTVSSKMLSLLLKLDPYIVPVDDKKFEHSFSARLFSPIDSTTGSIALTVLAVVQISTRFLIMPIDSRITFVGCVELIANFIPQNFDYFCKGYAGIFSSEARHYLGITP